MGKSFATNNWSGQLEALHSGQYAMAIGSDDYLHGVLGENNPDVDRFGLMPLYFGFNDQGSYFRDEVINIYVNRNSAFAEEALTFIRLAADANNLEAAYVENYLHPFLRASKAVKDQTNLGFRKSLIPATAGLIVGYSPVEIGAVVQEIMLGELSPEEAADKLDLMRIEQARAQKVPGF